MSDPNVRLHELKIWPQFYADAVSGAKTYEIRINDRGFKVGDRLHLREWDPETKDYTGQEAFFEIVHMTQGGPPISWIIPSNVCVMGIRGIVGIR